MPAPIYRKISEKLAPKSCPSFEFDKMLHLFFIPLYSLTPGTVVPYQDSIKDKLNFVFLTECYSTLS